MNKTKLLYMSVYILFSIAFLASKNSFALIIDDPDILQEIIECKSESNLELTDSLPSLSVCSKWVIDIPDKTAIDDNLKKDKLTIKCDKYINVDRSVNEFSSLLGFFKKTTSPVYYYTYKCSNGTVLSTPSCKVYTHSTERWCSCGSCICWAGCGWFCLEEVSQCSGDYWVDIRMWGKAFCMNRQYNTINTQVKNFSYNRHFVNRCDKVGLKEGFDIHKTYDVNKIYE